MPKKIKVLGIDDVIVDRIYNFKKKFLYSGMINACEKLLGDDISRKRHILIPIRYESPLLNLIENYLKNRRHADFYVSGGGSTSNVISNLNTDELGCYGEFWGAIGNDNDAEVFKQSFNGKLRLKVKKQNTCRAITLISPYAEEKGERRFLVTRPVEFGIDDLRAYRRYIKDFHYFCTSGFALKDKNRPLYKTIEECLDLTEHYGINTVLNIGTEFSENDLGNIRNILGYVGHIFGNKDEFRSITGEKNIENMCRQLISDYNIKNIFITDGRNGSYAFSGGRLYYEKAPRLARIVNKSGAGDAFEALILNDLVNGNFSPGKSLKRAMGYASKILTKEGARL